VRNDSAVAKRVAQSAEAGGDNVVFFPTPEEFPTTWLAPETIRVNDGADIIEPLVDPTVNAFRVENPRRQQQWVAATQHLSSSDTDGDDGTSKTIAALRRLRRQNHSRPFPAVIPNMLRVFCERILSCRGCVDFACVLAWTSDMYNVGVFALRHAQMLLVDALAVFLFRHLRVDDDEKDAEVEEAEEHEDEDFVSSDSDDDESKTAAIIESKTVPQTSSVRGRHPWHRTRERDTQYTPKCHRSRKDGVQCGGSCFPRLVARRDDADDEHVWRCRLCQRYDRLPNAIAFEQLHSRRRAPFNLYFVALFMVGVPLQLLQFMASNYGFSKSISTVLDVVEGWAPFETMAQYLEAAGTLRNVMIDHTFFAGARKHHRGKATRSDGNNFPVLGVLDFDASAPAGQKCRRLFLDVATSRCAYVCEKFVNPLLALPSNSVPPAVNRASAESSTVASSQPPQLVTNVHADCAREFDAIGRNKAVLMHRVNHRRHFASSSGACTNAIEGSWKCVKDSRRVMFGRQVSRDRFAAQMSVCAIFFNSRLEPAPAGARL
jgi:hypothetical protein